MPLPIARVCSPLTVALGFTQRPPCLGPPTIALDAGLWPTFPAPVPLRLDVDDVGEVVQSSGWQTEQIVVMATKLTIRLGKALSDITDTDTQPPPLSHNHRVPSWALRMGWRHRAVPRPGR